MLNRRMLPLLALGPLLAPGPALAHSELRSSLPADGARLPSPLARLRLTFNEPVQLTLLRLGKEGGGEIAVPRARDSSARITHEAAAPALAPGAYVLEWRAISADGHPIRGRIRFTVSP